MTVGFQRPLLIGFGNALRGDDALGCFVAELIAVDGRFDGVKVLAVHQLTPEIALDIAQASRVVIVDASVALAPGVIDATEIVAADETTTARAAMTHHVDAASLLGLARRLYSATPPTTLLSIGVSSTSDDGFSADVVAALPQIVERVAQLCLERSYA